MTTKADDLLRDAVRSGEVSGVVAMATASGSSPYVGAFGARSTVNSSRMTPDTIFQVSALVRPIMAVAGLQLVDSGVLGLDEPLRTVIPALNQPLVLTGFDRNRAPKLRPARGEITLRRVLNHTAGFNVGSWWDALADLERPWWAPPWAGSVSLLADPGSRWLHCSDIDLVAMIIERISGLTVSEYLYSEIFRELGMRDTGFAVGHRSRARVAGGWRKSDFDAGYANFYSSPKDYFETRWTTEQWTRGCPVGIAGPGTLLAYGDQLRAPIGAIHWAGTETSTYWNGYMDGAVRSGQRAAKEVLDEL